MATILDDTTHDSTHQASRVVEVASTNVIDNSQMEKARRIKVVTSVLLFAFVVFVVVDSLTAHRVGKATHDVLQWVEVNPIRGVFVYVAVYVMSTILLVPGMTFAGGFVFANALGFGWGMLIASVASFVGVFTGATASFFVGRYLFRDWFKSMAKTHKIVDVLEACMREDRGFRIMALLRLSPFLPFFPLNYLAGVTSISLWKNSLAMVFTIPGLLVYVLLGASAGSMAEGSNSNLQSFLMMVGVFFAVVAMWLTNYYVRKELDGMVEAPQASPALRGNLREAGGGTRSIERAEVV